MTDKTVAQYIERAQQPWLLRLAKKTSAFIFIGIALLVIRIAFLFLDPAPLGFDEAQYWSWKQDLAWGYFSKPPLLTYLMHLSTTAFQTEAEWAVRIISPILILGAALFVRASAARLHNEGTGNLAGILFLLIPAASVGSLFSTTDVPLIFFWAGALYFLVLARENTRISLVWLALCGVFVGLAALSKYTGLAFYLSLFIAALLDKDTRKALLPWGMFVAPVATLAVFSPHLLWSLKAGFITVQHVAQDANYTGLRFNGQDFFEFLGAQFGVFGPVLLAALLFMTFLPIAWKSIDQRFLFAMSWPWLLVMLSQAAMGGAEVNWAMPAYVGATVLVTLFCLSRALYWPLTASLLIGFAFVPLFYVGTLVIGQTHLNAPRSMDLYARLRFGPQFGDIITQEIDKLGPAVVLAESRKDLAVLLYYSTVPITRVYHWNPDRDRDNHYEMARDLEEVRDSEPILFVSFYSDLGGRETHFNSVVPLCKISIKTHQDRSYVRYLYRLQEFSGYLNPEYPSKLMEFNWDENTCILTKNKPI